LYIFSLEGLINCSWDHFLPERCRNFFVNRESGFSLEDKWELLPLLASPQQPPNLAMELDGPHYRLLSRASVSEVWAAAYPRRCGVDVDTGKDA
jgi:hypothetical protein